MTDLTVPDLGDGVEEGTVLAVLVEVGITVSEGQALLEIETDKVTFEIPSPRDGVIDELHIEANDILQTGDIFARMSFDKASSTADPVGTNVGAQTRPVMAPGKSTTAVQPPAGTPTPTHSQPTVSSKTNETVRAGPAARREARELGVLLNEVEGTGKRNRITKEDIRRHTKKLLTNLSSSPITRLPDLAAFGPIHKAPMSRLDKTIAANMSYAANTIPHSWISQKADITDLDSWRREFCASKRSEVGPPTLTALLCKVVGAALLEHPRLNSGIDMPTHTIVYRDYINVGIAVDAGRALYVPVIKNVDTLNLIEVARELERITMTARNNRIAGTDLKGAGITITNLGGIGVSAMQPIINPPEVAILGVSTAEKCLVGSGNSPDTRLHLPMTLGFDHRVVNGAEAAYFLNFICDSLATPKSTFGLSPEKTSC